MDVRPPVSPPEYFARIRDDAIRRWNKLEDDPGLAGPWEQLFRQVQDPRLVFSELLQNADDAGASRALVKIEGDTLVFEHDGEDFVEEHFRSICNFGFSSKRSLSTIGFRGIGFKSTFSLGDRVELITPTLSVEFRRERFTQPDWVADRNGNRTLNVMVRVRLRDERLRDVLAASFQLWKRDPISLLFFRKLRSLVIEESEVHWEEGEAGPVKGSQWFRRRGVARSEAVLVLRSAEESLPEDAADELRDERLLPYGELPVQTAAVSIVVGGEGRLYSVLPTGVLTGLPFAVNAPFVQDPARQRIKDPQLSPMNRWLLHRAGELAGRWMLDWLRGTATRAERVRAYALLPPPPATTPTDLGKAVANLVAQGFRAAIGDAPILLASNGTLQGYSECVGIPSRIRNLWPYETGGFPLDRKGRLPLAADIAERHVDALRSWGFVELLTPEDAWEQVTTTSLSHPEAWGGLVRLWYFLKPAYERWLADKPSDPGKTARIFPAEGSAWLHTPSQVFPPPRGLHVLSPDERALLKSIMPLMPEEFRKFLDDNVEREPDGESPLTADEVQWARRLLQEHMLRGFADNDVIKKALTGFILGENIPEESLIIATWIAAKLDLDVRDTWIYLDQYGRRHTLPNENLLSSDQEILHRFGLEELDFYSIDKRYTEPLELETKGKISRWIESEKSGLRAFPVPRQIELKCNFLL